MSEDMREFYQFCIGAGHYEARECLERFVSLPEETREALRDKWEEKNEGTRSM